MATWNSRGLRGSTLEEFINHTCELYREKKTGADPEGSHSDHPCTDRSKKQAYYPGLF